MKYSKNGQNFAMSKNASNVWIVTCWTLCKKPHLSRWSSSQYFLFWMTRYVQVYNIYLAVHMFQCQSVIFEPVFNSSLNARQSCSAQWLETIWNRRIHFIEKHLFPMSSGASEWMSKQANKWVQQSAWAKQTVWSKQINERWANEQVAQYSTRLFPNHLAHCAVAVPSFCAHHFIVRRVLVNAPLSFCHHDRKLHPWTSETQPVGDL